MAGPGAGRRLAAATPRETPIYAIRLAVQSNSDYKRLRTRARWSARRTASITPSGGARRKLSEMIRIWVDADACPVKSEIERLAGRRGLPIVHVCSVLMADRGIEGVSVVRVPKGPDAADDWIVEHCGPGDLVVTDDVPLAAAAVKLGATVLEFRGRELHAENVAMRSEIRDLVTSLRDRGEISGGGPPPFTSRDRRAFSAALGRLLDRLTR